MMVQDEAVEILKRLEEQSVDLDAQVDDVIDDIRNFITLFSGATDPKIQGLLAQLKQRLDSMEASKQ